MADYLNIAGRVRTTASDGVAMEAQEVKDLNQNKSQQQINADVQTELGDRYTKEETYSKEQLDELITTPDVTHVSVVATNATTAADIPTLINASGEGEQANTIYRVGNWNGTQYDPTMYALFAWNGTTYVCLAVRSFVGEVYDISVNHPDGQGNPTPYADLAAALGTSGANIPADIRRGGMSIKFIQGTAQSSDNKYVQYRLMADEFTTDTTQWAVADEGVYVENPEFIYVKTDNEDKILWAIKKDGGIYYGAGCPQQVKDYIDERIKDLSLDEYEDMVTFLQDFLGTDITLKAILDSIEERKVDKVEGKGLIDSEYAATKSTIDSPEWADVKTDPENKVLEGIKKDGTKAIGGDLKVGGNTTIKGNLKVLGKIEFEGVTYTLINSPEWIHALVDAEDKVICGIKVNGKFYADFANVPSESELQAAIADMQAQMEALSISVDEKLELFNSVFSVVDNPEYIAVETDSEGKILSYRDSEGVLHEEVGIETNHLELSSEGMTEFQQALLDSGFNPQSPIDWSDAKSIEIPTPRCALVNITNDNNTAVWPQQKKLDYKYYMEFWDMQGNYFKKEIIMNAQGTSSLYLEKKNGAVDICNNNGWDDGDTCKIKFGDWVPQDSFHFKAYHIDYIRGGAVVSYQIANEVMLSRGYFKDRPWKQALINFDEILPQTPGGLHAEGISDVSLQIDNGARCMPDGFPAIFYINGEFYGIYSWQIKKHRDNYHMNKSTAEHIHLDGRLETSTFWGGTVNWTQFEIRNPKNLCYAVVHTDDKGKATFKYDADITNGEDEIAGIDKNYDGDWAAGTYAVGRVVKKGSNYFINQVADNDKEPITQDASGNKNTAKDPDFKNKTKCGWINCTTSVKVKQYIIDLAGRCPAINELNSTDSAAAREMFDTYFDADNIVDYQVTNMAINDTDAFAKNWQWITYDGIKWWVCQYDKDNTFGNNFMGTHTSLPPTGGWLSSSTSLPTGLALRYYQNEHKLRWNELVSKGIFTKENFIDKINSWIARVGQTNYENEWKKWPNAPCNRDSHIDFDNWVFTSIDTIIQPISGLWNSETNYNIDDEVWYPIPGGGRWYKFKAVQNNINKPCVTIENPFMGYRDNVWRYYKFIEETLDNQTEFINNINV